MKGKNNKIEEIRSHRDLFDKLVNLLLSFQNEGSNKKLNIKSVLSIHLLKRPAYFCHPNGTLCKTDKSALMKVLEQRAPTNVKFNRADIIIINGFAIFYTLSNFASTYGQTFEQILKTVLNYSWKRSKNGRVDVIFDRYESPSIKDNKHKLRQNYSQSIKIPKRSTECRDFAKDLKNIEFKKALVEFLIDDWAMNDRASIIRQKTVLLSYDKCYQYMAVNKRVTRTIIENLTSNQLAVDTRIILHATNVYEMENDKAEPRRAIILIKAADT